MEKRKVKQTKRQRQEDYKFKTSLDYIMRTCFQNPRTGDMDYWWDDCLVYAKS
jgi:hypothetical protein